ncbi:MAG: NAD-dependent epimerase/dehydratase family protein [Leptolyngbya sp. PLA1]|nr:NAD-dependent epimerase/dehydratase family protein [Leptolyngbya sp. PLA1]
MLDWRTQRVLLTGGHGFLGRAVHARLLASGVPESAIVRFRSAERDLRDPAQAASAVRSPWGGAGPTLVINCAGFVGGLGANRKWPSRFFFDTMAIAMHTLEESRRAGFISPAFKFIQIGTMCSYPADAPIPYRESSLFRGLPDAEIASYGVAKLATLQMLEAYRLEHGLRSAYVIPTGFFGPGDNMDPANSHVAGALVRKYVEASSRGDAEVVNWGSGAPTRDFIYIDDAARGVLLAAERVDTPTPINLTGGVEVSIHDLAALVSRLTGYRGRTVWDTTKGDGQPRRCLDGTKARELLGFEPATSLEEGLKRTVDWYRGTRG